MSDGERGRYAQYAQDDQPELPAAATTGAPVTPSQTPSRGLISPAQLTILVVCVISIFFIIGFYGKSLDSYRVGQRASQVKKDNARLEGEIKALQEKVAFYATDSYLETTAREKLNLVKPGDRPLVVLAAGAEIATVEGPPPVDARPFAELGHLADWLFLFFGNR